MTHIDDIFRQGMERHEPQPSGDVWENIQASGVLEKKREPRIYAWAAAASILMLMSGGLYYWTVTMNGVDDGALVFTNPVSDTLLQMETEDEKNKSFHMGETSTADTLQIVPLAPSKDNLPEVKRKASQKARSKSRHPQQWQKTETRYAANEPEAEGKVEEQMENRTQYARVEALSLPRHSIQSSANKPLELKWQPEVVGQFRSEPIAEETPSGWRGRFFRSAKNKLTDWAENAGIPVTELAGITEIEIQY
jgi:hypothetical protein